MKTKRGAQLRHQVASRISGFGSFSLQLVFGSAVACSLITGTLLAFFRSEAPKNVTCLGAAGLTFQERIAYQRAIEEVYWRHRTWPKENAKPKPSFDEVMSAEQIEKKVADYLRDSQALEDRWQQPITAEQLQAEMNRMAQHTKEPEVLRELFAALGDDPFVVAECLARPVLAQRLVTELNNEDRVKLTTIAWLNASYTLPAISSPSAGCIDDTWTSTTATNAPEGRQFHTVVWTGSEMIVWGGDNNPSGDLNTGGRYDPSTDSWTATSTTNVPASRHFHTAVWTGTEMIIWGGSHNSTDLDTGGRYNPGTDSWTATSTTKAPEIRVLHTAVWTGNEMIVWGGVGGSDRGGRYNPTTDSWTATSTTNAPEPRYHHTAVWTGSEMIVWGGQGTNNALNNGGRYNPGTDSWAATSTTNTPTARFAHTAVWTGSEMTIWGGYNNGNVFNTGARYNPATDSWTATSTTNSPDGREYHTAIWTGSEMIVWGGYSSVVEPPLNTGGRYNPGLDTWMATSTTNVPAGRTYLPAIWTGNEMIVWGGYGGGVVFLNNGGRYCAAALSPTPTPIATPTPTLTPQPTPTSSRRPCDVIGSQPACDSTVFTEVTGFAVHVSSYIYGSVQPSVFTVNGIPADSGSGGGTAWFFHFNASPVVQGENTMHIPSDAFTCTNGRGVGEFMCTFTYQPSPPTPTPIPTPTPAPRYTPTPRPRRTPASRP